MEYLPFALGVTVSMIPWVLFAIVCRVNCVIIRAWEAAAKRMDEYVESTKIAGFMIGDRVTDASTYSPGGRRGTVVPHTELLLVRFDGDDVARYVTADMVAKLEEPRDEAR